MLKKHTLLVIEFLEQLPGFKSSFGRYSAIFEEKMVFFCLKSREIEFKINSFSPKIENFEHSTKFFERLESFIHKKIEEKLNEREKFFIDFAQKLGVNEVKTLKNGAKFFEIDHFWFEFVDGKTYSNYYCEVDELTEEQMYVIIYRGWEK